MGKLVVATDHGGARETIIPNETGYLVPNDQPKVMAEAIQYALGLDAETTKAMGEFAELCAGKYPFTREEQDEFSLSSHQKAALAIE